MDRVKIINEELVISRYREKHRIQYEYLDLKKGGYVDLRGKMALYKFRKKY